MAGERKIDIRMTTTLMARIDAWRERQPIKPNRSAAIRHMIELFLRVREK